VFSNPKKLQLLKPEKVPGSFVVILHHKGSLAFCNIN